MRPATDPRLLDSRVGTVAHNLVLRGGTGVPMQGGAVVTTAAQPVATLTQLHAVGTTPGQIMTLDYQAAILEAPFPGSADYGSFVVFPYGSTGRKPQRWLPAENRFAPLTVPAPTAAPVCTLLSDFTLPNTYTGPDQRSYVYTWVDEFGVESRPSPPSPPLRSFDGATWRIEGFSAPPANAVSMRVYRSSSAFDDGRKASNAFDTSFQLTHDQDLPLSPSFLTDSNVLDDIDGGTMLSYEDTSVPPVLNQVLLTEQGYYVGWFGTTVYISERHEPHNWPRRYELSLADNIVGMAVQGVHVFVGTTGRPYRVSITPSERTVGQATAMPMADAVTDAQQYPFDWPCLSRYAMVSTDFGAVYPTRQGLVALRSQGGVLLETRERIDETQWVEWVPNTAAWHRGRYYACNAPVGKSWVMDLTADGDSIEMGDLVTADLDFTLAHNGRDGFLYFAKGRTVTRWEAGNPLPYRWRSKVFVMPGYLSFAGAKVSATYGLPIIFRLYRGQELMVTREVVSGKPFRLPFHPRGIEWSLELEGVTPFNEVHVATSFTELTIQETLA